MKKIISILVLAVMCLTLFAGCNNDQAEQGETANIDLAVEYLRALYKDKDEVTPNDFSVVSVLKVDGVSYDVDWSVDVKEGVVVEAEKDNEVVINVDEKTSKDIKYVLTAIVKSADGNTKQTSFKFKVPAYKVNTWDEYVAAEKGVNLTIAGKVTGIISKSNGANNNCIFIQGTEGGGFYIYGMKQDPIKDLNLKLGMEVEASGVKDNYNGTLELKDAKVTVANTEVKEISAKDFTEIYKAAADLKAKELTDLQGLLVTLKDVEVTGQDQKNGYYNFKIGDKEAYIRISGSTCALNKEEKEAFQKAHAEHFGWKANVTGLISLYNGAFYLVPATADAFEYLSAIEKTPAEKVEIEAGNIKFNSIISKDTEVKLPLVGANYEDVKIAWTSDNAVAVISEDGTLKITMPDKDVVIKLTATVTCGEATKTVELSVKLQVKELTYAEIVELLYGLEGGVKTDDAYRLFGTITSIDTAYSDQYKNVTVTIKIAGLDDKPVVCFRLKGEGAENLKVGDAITVEGKLEHYVKGDKNSYQLSYGKLIGMGEIIDQTKIVENAYALAKGEAMSGPSVLQGVITKVNTPYSEQYKNVTVTIAIAGIEDKPIECFRLKGEGAKDLKEGQTITVFGVLKNYEGKIEFDSGCMLVANEEFINARAVAALYSLAENDKLAQEVTLKGVITKVDTPYSEQYKNVTVTIEFAGLKKYPIMCFRLKGEGAEKLAEGDVITVTGILQHYVNKEQESLYQFTSGCTFTK